MDASPIHSENAAPRRPPEGAVIARSLRRTGPIRFLTARLVSARRTCPTAAGYARCGSGSPTMVSSYGQRGCCSRPTAGPILEALWLFEIEREINGMAAEKRLTARKQRSAPLVGEFEAWMRASTHTLAPRARAQAMDYMLRRWDGFIRFLEDGRVCLTNNAAERALRGIALGRKAWLFAGSDRGGERAAFMYRLSRTAKLNDVDPQAWLADVLARIADTPQNRLPELLPWNWRHRGKTLKAA